jgi:prophage regulatory protein
MTDTTTTLPRLLRLPDVMARTGLGRDTIYRLERAGEFPARVRLGARATAWREDELLVWLDARPRAVDAGPDAAAGARAAATAKRSAP